MSRDLTPDEEDFLDRVAQRVRRLGCTPLALFLLEAHRPLEFFAGQFVHFSVPVFSFFVSRDSLSKLADLLSRKKALEALIERLSQES